MSRFTAIALVACVCFAAPVMGNMMEMKYLGTGQGRNVKIALDGQARNVFAGEIRHAARNGTGLGAWFEGMTLSTFCTEIEQNTSGSWKQFTITNPGLVTPANPVAAKTQALADMFAMLRTQRGLGAFNSDMAAAFQLAVWEIVYDYDAEAGRSSLDITAGRFDARQTNGNALSTAITSRINGFWDAIGSGARTLDIFGFHNSSAQDQIVPTPGGVALAGLGLTMMGLRRRK